VRGRRPPRANGFREEPTRGVAEGDALGRDRFDRFEHPPSRRVESVHRRMMSSAGPERPPISATLALAEI
jgi:hypothetical protein